tara:strand:- start:15 stop:662 length:648 start_codon:yes stop_codon:yes gene_type:complete
MKPIRVVEMDYQLEQINKRFSERSEKVEFMYNRDLQSRVEAVLPEFKKALGLNEEIAELEQDRKKHLDLIHGHARQVEDSETALKGKVQKLENKINSYKTDNELSSMGIYDIEIESSNYRDMPYSPKLEKVNDWCISVCKAIQQAKDKEEGHDLAVQIEHIKELRQLAKSYLYEGTDLSGAVEKIQACYNRAGIRTINSVSDVPMLAIGNDSDSA